VHHDATREIQRARFLHPSTAPDPVRHRRINQHQPERGKEQNRAELHPFHKRTDDQSGSDNRKRHLKHDEDRFGIGAPGGFTTRDPAQTEMIEIPDPAVAVRKCQTVQASHPQHGGKAGDCEAVHQNGQYVLHPYETAIEQRESWQRHEQNQDRRGNHPCRVSRIQKRRRLGMCDGR
jgi:hypothetical protein